MKRCLARGNCSSAPRWQRPRPSESRSARVMWLDTVLQCPGALRPRGSYLRRRKSCCWLRGNRRSLGPRRLKAMLFLAGLDHGGDGLPAQEEAEHTGDIITTRVSTLAGRRISLRLAGRRTTARQNTSITFESERPAWRIHSRRICNAHTWTHIHSEMHEDPDH